MCRLTRHAYAAAATAAAPALSLLLRRRVARGKEWPDRLAERRGIEASPRPDGRLLWLHAASVGETVSILPVLSALDTRVHVLLTTGTVTSARLLAQRLPELGLAERVTHRFVPLDVPRWAARFLDHWRPDAAAFVESELWPNLLAACQARGIQAALINARMSERSLRNWQRLPGLARDMLSAFAHVQARSQLDADRLRRLGATNVTAPGDLKFAAPSLPADAAELERLRTLIGRRPVWLAASTHPGEEKLIAQAHAALVAAHPGLLTIVVPRHPERGASIAAELRAPRRSIGDGPPTEGVWIADTLGELGLFYRLAGLAFIGKSLIGDGGQNPLEPARLGCAIAVGPNTANFAAAVAALETVGALVRVRDEQELSAWVNTMLRDPSARAAAGEAARAAAAGFSELPAHTAALLSGLLDRSH